MKIEKFKQNDFEQLQEIFFESSNQKKFKNAEEKESFFYKYLGYYIENHSNFILVAKDNKKVFGYLCAAIDSKSCLELYKSLSHYKLFEDLYESFPTHLHMNTHFDARGKGIGSRLIDVFIDRYSKETHGIHIITSITSQNVKFYRKNRFDTEFERSFGENSLFFMGRSV